MNIASGKEAQTAMSELTQYKERLHVALTAAKICIFEVDIQKQLYTYFENAEVIFGVSGESILKDVQPYSRLDPEAYRLAVSRYFSHPEDEAVIENAFSDVLAGKSTAYEARMKAGNSGYIWCRIFVTPVMENGVPARMVGVITDISDMKEQTDCLRQAVKLDAFTGLYNKEHTIKLITENLRRESHMKHALIILDIDNFKNFNDTFGHFEGDKVIKAVAEKIQNTFRKTDIAGRFGGDEFIILARDIDNDRWLWGKLSGLTRIETDGIACTNSIGVSIWPRDAADFGELFKKADTALYHAKAEKEKFLFCTAQDG